MDFGDYLEANFVVGGALLLLFFVVLFAFSKPYLSLLALVILAVLAYRYYRREVYFDR
ncbi:hypothetical protein ACFQJC_09490 [Haloferax namakaokahaiae]|uniref:Uncharacterized protein n=1 Tax=Haloferax namakaokahaiae TaxID=1748331 RepID=A0ABD5ZEV4_9EURY